MAELPDCAACGEPVTFYMHQNYGKETGKMVYYHPRCCPEQACKERESIYAHQDKATDVPAKADTRP